MIRLRYPHQPKARPTPIYLNSKSANTHLRLLQSTAKAENLFSIIPIAQYLFDKSAPVIYDTYDKGDQNKHTSGELRTLFFDRITKGSYPNLMFILSAFDPLRISRYIPESWHQAPPPNVMYNLLIQDQLSDDTLMSNYLRLKGPKAVSLQSQTSEISILPLLQTGKIDWVTQRTASAIDSVTQKTPTEIDWLHKIALECKASDTPYHGVWNDRLYFHNDLIIPRFPDDIFYSAYDACNQPPISKPERIVRDIFGGELGSKTKN